MAGFILLQQAGAKTIQKFNGNQDKVKSNE